MATASVHRPVFRTWTRTNRDNRRIIETTAMGAVRVPDLFTHYIFVDRDPRCMSALANRIAAAGVDTDPQLFTGDVNDLVIDIKAALPRFSKQQGLITFCFVDPFDANLKFRTLRSLAEYRMDFLILLMLGQDVRRNFKKYYLEEQDVRIAELIDCPDWRERYRSKGGNIVRFVLGKFDEAMTGLGYYSCTDDLVHQVKVAGKNVFLYSLVFYSRHERGRQFWRDTLRGASPQLALELP